MIAVVLAVGLLLVYAYLNRAVLARRGQRRFGTRSYDFIPSPEERLSWRPRKRAKPVPLQPVQDSVPLYAHRSKFESEHCEVCRRQPRMRFENGSGSAFEFCALHGQEQWAPLASQGYVLAIDTR